MMGLDLHVVWFVNCARSYPDAATHRHCHERFHHIWQTQCCKNALLYKTPGPENRRPDGSDPKNNVRPLWQVMMVQVAQDRATNSPQIQSPTVSLLPLPFNAVRAWRPPYLRSRSAALSGAALIIMWYHNCYLCSSCCGSNCHITTGGP
jgi:hypothetical protein